MAYSSTASQGKGTEYLKRETTFTYDDTQGDEWSEQRNANQLEIYVNTVTVGSDSGILLSAGGGLERFGSTSIEFQSTVHYRQHSDYLGTAFDTQNPSEILWTYDSNRDASFDHTATLTITVYPLVDSLVISYTTSGDTAVTLTGQDDWGRDWEKTELERSLEGMAATSQDSSILAENSEAIDAANDTNKQDTSTWQQVADGGEGGDGTEKPYGIGGSIGLGLYLGLAQGGQFVSTPLRWVGVDFSEQDRALDNLWRRLHAPEGTRAQTQIGWGGRSWSRCGRCCRAIRGNGTGYNLRIRHANSKQRYGRWSSPRGAGKYSRPELPWQSWAKCGSGFSCAWT